MNIYILLGGLFCILGLLVLLLRRRASPALPHRPAVDGTPSPYDRAVDDSLALASLEQALLSIRLLARSGRPSLLAEIEQLADLAHNIPQQLSCHPDDRLPMLFNEPVKALLDRCKHTPRMVA